MPKPSHKAAPRKENRHVLDLDRHVPYFFTYISSRLSRGSSQLFNRYFGLGITDWRVMAVLASMPDVSANQISSAVGLDKAAVSRALRTLDQRGFIDMVDDPDDSRSRTVCLSTTGVEMHDRIIPIALERERRLLSTLSPAETEMLIKCLRKIRLEVPRVNAFDPGNSTEQSA